MEELIESREGEFYSTLINGGEFLYCWYDSSRVTRAEDMVVTSEILKEGWFAIYLESFEQFNVEVYARAKA